MNNNDRKPWVLIAIAAVFAFLIFGELTGGSGTAPEPTTTPDVEEQLAILTVGSAEAAVVRDYRLALNAAEPACTQDRQGIGDIGLRGTEIAEDRGIDTTPLELIRAIPQAVPASERPTDCAEILSALLVLLTP